MASGSEEKKSETEGGAVGPKLLSRSVRERLLIGKSVTTLRGFFLDAQEAIDVQERSLEAAVRLSHDYRNRYEKMKEQNRELCDLIEKMAEDDVAALRHISGASRRLHASLKKARIKTEELIQGKSSTDGKA